MPRYRRLTSALVGVYAEFELLSYAPPDPREAVSSKLAGVYGLEALPPAYEPADCCRGRLTALSTYSLDTST